MVGMLGLTQTIRRTFGWALRLMFGRIERLARPPASPSPCARVDDTPACHAPAADPPPATRAPRAHRSRRLAGATRWPCFRPREPG